MHPAKTQIILGIHPIWSVFAVRMKKAWVLSYLLWAQQRLIRLGRCPGWSESLLGAHAILLVLSCTDTFDVHLWNHWKLQNLFRNWNGHAETVGLLIIWHKGPFPIIQINDLGPVVQSVVSLTSSLRVISLTVLVDSIYNILICFAEKMWVIFSAKTFSIFTFFQQKLSAYLRIIRCKF